MDDFLSSNTKHISELIRVSMSTIENLSKYILGEFPFFFQMLTIYAVYLGI